MKRNFEPACRQLWKIEMKIPIHIRLYTEIQLDCLVDSLALPWNRCLVRFRVWNLCLPKQIISVSSWNFLTLPHVLCIYSQVQGENGREISFFSLFSIFFFSLFRANSANFQIFCFLMFCHWFFASVIYF